MKGRNPAGQNHRASAARSAAGRPAKKTSGSVSAVTHGIPLIREACAQPAFTSGAKPSAFRVAAGRSTRDGIPSDGAQLVWSRIPSNVKSEHENSGFDPDRRIVVLRNVFVAGGQENLPTTRECYAARPSTTQPEGFRWHGVFSRGTVSYWGGF